MFPRSQPLKSDGGRREEHQVVDGRPRIMDPQLRGFEGFEARPGKDLVPTGPRSVLPGVARTRNRRNPPAPVGPNPNASPARKRFQSDQPSRLGRMKQAPCNPDFSVVADQLDPTIGPTTSRDPSNHVCSTEVGRGPWQEVTTALAAGRRPSPEHPIPRSASAPRAPRPGCSGPVSRMVCM